MPLCDDLQRLFGASQVVGNAQNSVQIDHEPRRNAEPGERESLERASTYTQIARRLEDGIALAGVLSA